VAEEGIFQGIVAQEETEVEASVGLVGETDETISPHTGDHDLEIEDEAIQDLVVEAEVDNYIQSTQVLHNVLNLDDCNTHITFLRSVYNQYKDD